MNALIENKCSWGYGNPLLGAYADHHLSLRKHSVGNTGPYHIHLDSLSITQFDAWSNLKFYVVNDNSKIFSQKHWYLTEISVAFVILDSG